ncbi:alpha/beta-hydrolase [Auriscalpium vulgare]|uniref:Alpha/beta-hydrolase n=1 Tax=Auriscalpium vulgare TaxID=40419 RepID=A0ACB8RST7_9AGAM|nr:alpha/beta-hydrolase [Auriscalpium vulgare]
MTGLRLLVAICCLALVVRSAPPPALADVNSSITLLFQNNLDYTDDANHPSFLLLESPLSHSAALSACAELNETLLSAASAERYSTDLVPQLQYAAYRGDFPLTQAFWLADGTARMNFGSLGVLRSTSGDQALPALCTQSAAGTTNSTSVPEASNMLSVHGSHSGATYTGFRDHKSFRFLGIPYADPPARFAYSSVAQARGLHLDATSYGAQCVQLVFASGTYSEDCLFLNVFTPHLPAPGEAPHKLRPVLVWIHGGAYAIGTAADKTFDGGNLASRGDIVLVTINYRLSSLGFLAIPGTSIKGNYGIADQITALQWVKENIQTFGGDPSRVTIYGQSAGGSSVRALLSSPKARGLFAAAIPASSPGGYDVGSTYSDYMTPAQEFTLAGQAVLDATNCTSTDLAAEVACLKAAPAASLVNVASAALYVIVDGTYITTSELNVTAPGKAAHVPVLWGTMADDSAVLLAFPPPGTNRTAAIAAALPSEPDLAALVDQSALFPTPSTGNASLDMFNLTVRIATDAQFRCLDQATVHSAVRHGVLPTAFYYQFDRSWQQVNYDPNAPVCDAPPTAAHPAGDLSLPYLRCHSGELWYVFGSMGQFGTAYRDAQDVTFTQLVMDYWTSFVRTHDPNPDVLYLHARNYSETVEVLAGSGRWEPVTAAKDVLQRLNWPPSQSSFLELEQCALLRLPVSYYDSAASSK